MKAVGPAILRQSLDAPEGIVSVDRKTHHTWRPFYLARMRSDGQFDIVSKSIKPILPAPFPFTRTRADWTVFLDGLYAGWGNQWANPVDEHALARQQAREAKQEATIKAAEPAPKPDTDAPAPERPAPRATPRDEPARRKAG